MKHTKYFNGLGRLISLSRYSIGTSVEERRDPISADVIITIEDMRFRQSFALARFINIEYPRYCGEERGSFIFDPIEDGPARIVDSPDEVIQIKIPGSQIESFEGFLQERRDDILFVLNNYPIGEHLRSGSWPDAKRAIEGRQRQPA